MYELLVSDFLQPFTVFYLLTGIALLNLWRKRRETRSRLLGVMLAFAVLTVLCEPAVSYMALGSLEWPNPPLRQPPTDTEAIVVLSSYVYPPDTIRLRPEMDEDTLNRCLKAAELYRGKPCPVVVTGGKVDPDAPGPACSNVMCDFLVFLGVKASDVIVENRSRNTYENAVESRKLLDERQIRKIILITDAPHLVRAAGCFRKQGLEVVPCGCQYRATHFEASLSDFLPKPSAAQNFQRACHEWLGVAWYWLRGRI